MPYKSAAQRGYFHAHQKELEAQGVNISEWDQSSKGKKLPYHVKKNGGAISKSMKKTRRYRAEGGGVFGGENPDDFVQPLVKREAPAELAMRYGQKYLGEKFDQYARDENGNRYIDQPQPAVGKTPPLYKDDRTLAFNALNLASNFAPGPKGLGLLAKAGTALKDSIFLGPLAAKALRATQGMHPTVGAHLLSNEAQILARAAAEGPEALSAARRGIQNNRDAIAAIDLKNNPAPDPQRDRLRFALTGTARNAADQPVKEAPDLGLGLVPTDKHREFKITHPAGDLHEALGIPPVKFDRNLPPGDAVTNRKTNEITLGGDPWLKSHMKKALGALVHELDHVAGIKDKMPMGSSPSIEPIFPQMYKQGLGRDAPSDAEQIRKAGLAQAFGLKVLPDAERRAAYDAYRRSAGEVSAENSRGRRAKGYKYLQYPEDTEHTGRGQQIVRFERDFDKRSEEVNKADGGSIGDLIKKFEGRLEALSPESKYEMGKRLLKREFLRRMGVDEVSSFPWLPGQFDDGPTVQQQERRMDDPELPNIHNLRNREQQMEHNLRKPWGSGIKEASPYAIHMAGGGNPYAPKQQKASDISGYMSRKMIHKAVNPGMLKSDIPGRTDKLPISVPAGSYVLPADVVSGHGQGNSDAGSAVMDKIFKGGMLGVKAIKPKTGAASRIGTARLTKGSKISFAAGGGVEPVDVIAAGGEYILHPEQVMAIGNGDLDKGHQILDQFVLHSRKNLIKTLKKLPGPAKD